VVEHWLTIGHNFARNLYILHLVLVLRARMVISIWIRCNHHWNVHKLLCCHENGIIKKGLHESIRCKNEPYDWNASKHQNYQNVCLGKHLLEAHYWETKLRAQGVSQGLEIRYFQHNFIVFIPINSIDRNFRRCYLLQRLFISRRCFLDHQSL